MLCCNGGVTRHEGSVPSTYNHVRIACREGNTALHMACQSNQLKVIEVLLQWGARPGMQNASGFAPVCTPVNPGSTRKTSCTSVVSWVAVSLLGNMKLWLCVVPIQVMPAQACSHFWHCRSCGSASVLQVGAFAAHTHPMQALHMPVHCHNDAAG